MKYKLICMDLDGTLLKNDKTISNKNLQTIKFAIDKGIYVTFATGRQYAVVKNILEKLDITINAPILTSNGAYIIYIEKNQLISRIVLGKENLEKVINILKKYDLDPNFQSDKLLISHRNNKRLNSYTNMKKSKFSMRYNIMLTDDLRECVLKESENILKVNIFGDEGSFDIIDCKKELKKIGGLTVESSMKDNIEIMNCNVNKGNGVKIISDYLGISREEIICIGDGENDLSMIKYAGMGIAMENALNIVKEASNWITDTNENDGIAKVIEKFVL